MAGKTTGPESMSVEEKNLFLIELKKSCNVTKSSEAIGYTRRTLYNYKKDDKAFSDAWDNALEEGVDNLEFKAQTRAFDGVEKVIYYKGEEIGKEKEYSDGLTTFLLRAHRPEKYAKDAAVSLTAPGGVIVIPEGTNKEDWVKKHGDKLAEET